MRTVTVIEARSLLHELVDDTAGSHEPIRIIGKRTSAVLVAEEAWQAIQETLHLLSVPGMRESIREGMATPVAECGEDISW